MQSFNGIRIGVDRRAIRFSSLHLFAKISMYLLCKYTSEYFSTIQDNLVYILDMCHFTSDLVLVLVLVSVLVLRVGRKVLWRM